MSDSTFYILPSDPDYMPSPERQREFDEYFMQVFGVADAHYAIQTDAPMMVGDGEVSSVGCPACRSALRMFTPDYEPSLHYAWFETVRTLLAYDTCHMPCCGAQVKAIELKLDPAYPYARFARGALNPGMDEHWIERGYVYELDSKVAAHFEEVLGASVSQLWVYGT